MTDLNDELQAEIEKTVSASVEKPRLDPTISEKSAYPLGKPDAFRAVAKAVTPNATSTVITAATLRADNNAKLDAIAEERKTINNDIARIDDQMNRLLDLRNAAIARQMELAQAEAMIRAAQTVGNAPRWSQQ